MIVTGGNRAQRGGQVVLSVPGGPSGTTLQASARNLPEASAATWGWAAKSHASCVLTAADPAARMRGCAWEAFRADTPRSRTAGTLCWDSPIAARKYVRPSARPRLVSESILEAGAPVGPTAAG